MAEDRYEALELIIKVREDGVSWFDIITDLISEDCEGGGGDCIVEDHNCDDNDGDDCEYDEVIPCTCGLESAGGMTGTLSQCFKWLMPDEEWEDD